MPAPLAALELFCGIGGFAAAVAGSNATVIGALDQSEVALAVYRYNFPGHPARPADLEKTSAAELAACAADLWWLSPPCQPYSVRGRQRDLADPRARSLLAILSAFAEIPEERLPRYLALENVAGFASSAAHARLTALLAGRGYQLREWLLCPTELGVPSRRPRYYLLASRAGWARPRPADRQTRPLYTFLEPAFDQFPPEELLLPPPTVARFGNGLRILDPFDREAYTTCFTAGYGRSLMHAGSYLATVAGVRRFAPQEIARFLGFPCDFRFPDGLPLRKCWHLLGNSLSVTAVRAVLAEFPGLALAAGER
jgi:site-specific DNA-cytosine methylase